MKRDTFGNVIWAKSAGGNNVDIATSVQFGKDGNTFITGYFRSTLTFGSITLQNNHSGLGVFVAKLEDVAGIEESEPNRQQMFVFPNPAEDVITVELQRQLVLKDCILTIWTSQGQRVLQQQLSGRKTEINVSGLKRGIYLLLLSDGGESEATIMVKQ
jgi:hypothetical protein